MDPNHIPIMLTRRMLLRDLVLMVGGSAVTLPVNLWSMEATKPRFLDDATFALLDEVCELIIPATDTPGARGTGVPIALDTLLRDWASAETQQQIRDLLVELDGIASINGGAPMLQLEPQQRIDILSAFDAEHFRTPPYSTLKGLVLRLYYFSEVGATQELRYEHTPGAWEPEIKITPETRTWASTGYM